MSAWTGGQKSHFEFCCSMADRHVKLEDAWITKLSQRMIQKFIEIDVNKAGVVKGTSYLINSSKGGNFSNELNILIALGVRYNWLISEHNVYLQFSQYATFLTCGPLKVDNVLKMLLNIKVVAKMHNVKFHVVYAIP